jgi:hypothetical protein
MPSPAIEPCRWGVGFHAVVFLDDFNIEPFAEKGCRYFGELHL